MRELRAQGLGYEHVARSLDAEGHATRVKGRRWFPTTVQRILQRAR